MLDVRTALASEGTTAVPAVDEGGQGPLSYCQLEMGTKIFPLMLSGSDPC